MSDVICNPLNLPYRLQDVRSPHQRPVFREGADPTIIEFKGRYHLFMSMSGGFFASEDLVSWTFHATPSLPVYGYAPDVRQVGDHLYFSASRSGKGALYRTTDPLHGSFEKVEQDFRFWDPHLFCDDDGAVYFYWGCSNRTPIYGVRLDPTTMTPATQPVALIAGAPETHGWEQVGENHDPRDRNRFAKAVGLLTGGGPFIEGAWMTKHDGTYYLQYAAPATEQNTYADGYYTADSPLGPFTYSPDSPFSSKPGGFINGAGHGSTFQDRHGNWWHTATMRISARHMFERRIGLFPAGFDDDGVFFCNQNFADYPMIVPDRRIDPWHDTFCGWMLLSRNKSVTALSSSSGHGPELAVNEDVRTWWAAGRNEPGHWLSIDLGEVQTVHAVQVNFAEHEIKRPRPPQRAWVALDMRYIDTEAGTIEHLLEASADGTTWTPLRDTRGAAEDVPHDLVVLPEPLQARYVRVTGYQLPYGSTFALSGVRVFGRGAGKPPAAVEPTASRVSPVAAQLRWQEAPGADGYNVRYGRSPGKLYHSWMVYGRNNLRLTGLNAGADYFVAVDAFNENGVTEGEPVAAS